MKRKKILQQEVHTAAEVARYLGALSEDFQSRVHGIAEMTLGLDKKMDRRFDEVDTTLQTNTEMIGKMATDVEIIKQDIEFLKSGFKKKTDYDEFLLLGRRVAVLESRIRR